MTQTRIKVLVGCIMAIILGFIVLYLSNHYAFYNVNEIDKYNKVFVDTTYAIQNEIIVEKQNTGLYGPRYANYSVNGMSEDAESMIYNTFKISGLEPVTEYTANVRFTFDPINAEGTNNLKVGFINYMPDEYYNDETNINYSNITSISPDTHAHTESETIDSSANITEVKTDGEDVSSANTFTNLNVIDGTNVYSVETSFETNERGEIWLVVGLDTLEQQNIDYAISNVIINYTEKK